MNLGGKSISVIWNEYTSTLKARDDDWRAGNAAAQRLYRRKILYYLEIARQSELCGSLEAALNASQARLDAAGSNDKLEAQLTEEKKDRSPYENERLTSIYKSL